MWPVSRRWKQVNLVGIVPKSKVYIDKTTEHVRMNMHNIPTDLARLGIVFAKSLGDQGGPYRRTHSIRNRLQKYINKPSRDGSYIEVLPEEVDELQDLPGLVKHTDLRLVEVGFNRWNEICKVAYTTALESSGRVCFLCMGLDGGLKTFYVTPKFKWRSKYNFS